MMPSFNFNGELIMSRILSDNAIPRGKWCEVLIQLPYGDKFEHIYKNVAIDTKFKLNVGGKIIGEGVITDI